jgi:hypothetical protein
MESHIGGCLDHEHEWCVIPLHEDAQICALCGKITPTVEIDGFEDTDRLTEIVACGHVTPDPHYRLLADPTSEPAPAFLIDRQPHLLGRSHR